MSGGPNDPVDPVRAYWASQIPTDPMTDQWTSPYTTGTINWNVLPGYESFWRQQTGAGDSWEPESLDLPNLYKYLSDTGYSVKSEDLPNNYITNWAVDKEGKEVPGSRVTYQQENQSLWDVIKEAAPLAAIMGGAYLGGLGLESVFGSGAGTAAGTAAGTTAGAGAGGLEAALTDAALAAASGTTPEALAAWASGAGAGTGELAALGGLGAGGAGAAGAGIGGLEGAAFADLAAGALPELATPSLYQAGLGAVPEFVGNAAGFIGEGIASGIPAWDAALTSAGLGTAAGTGIAAASPAIDTSQIIEIAAKAGSAGPSLPPLIAGLPLIPAFMGAVSPTTPPAPAEAAPPAPSPAPAPAPAEAPAPAPAEAPAPAPAPAEGPQVVEVTGPKAPVTPPGIPPAAVGAVLTPAVISSLYGEPGYGTNKEAIEYAEKTGMDPSKVGSSAYPLVPPWIEKLGTAAVTAFQKNPLGFLAAGASLFGGDGLGGSGSSGGGGSNVPVNMGLAARRTLLPQPEYKPYSGEAVMGRQFFSPVTYANAPAAPTTPVNPEPIMDSGQPTTGGGLAAGGSINSPRYLRGSTDGMADELDGEIDGKRPAKLSHGEFVIPADVVSHLGNGNSDAGAEELYKMMDRIRQARTGTKKQGKRIKPEKLMPKGIAAAFANGGAVAFQDGGMLPGTGDLGTSQSSTLSSWAAPYVTNILSQGQALGAEPYQAYTGPLSAGVSPLQQTAFSNAQNLGGTFDANAAQQYMNPYIQTALNPQLDLLRRQSDISLQNDLSKYTQAGAFGGSRSAIAQGLNRENLGQQMERVTGQAYQNAFDRAMQQFNTQQTQNISNVNAQAALGGQQRDVEQQGINALRGEFEMQRDYPQRQLAFQQGLLRGLPISTQTTTPMTSGLGSILGDVAGAASIYKLIGDLFTG